MVDIFAALSLLGATSKVEASGQLFEDAELLYSFYSNAKDAPVDFQALQQSGKLAPLVAAIARTSHVADALLKDPSQAKNVAALLNSIK